MKTKFISSIISAIIFLGSSNSVAQSRFFIGAGACLNYTTLLNKDDRKADSRLNYQFSVAPEADIKFGYDFNVAYGGLRSITLGLGYFNVVQNYSGDNTDDPRSGFRNLEAQTNLNYLKIPLMLDFSFREKKRVNIIASIGVFYAYLLNYKDEMNATSAYGSGTVFPPIHYEMKNNDYSFQLLAVADNGKTDKFYYKRSIWGLQGRIGGEINMNDRWSVTISANGSYSLSDIENKQPIDHSGTLLTYNPWELMLPKYYSDNAMLTFNTNDRPPTRILSLGLGIGITYKL